MSVKDTEAFKALEELMGENLSLLISQYIQDSKAYIQQIDNALQSDDIAAMRSPAHTLKSSSKQLGAMQLSEQAFSLEKVATEKSALSNDEKDEVQQQVKQLKDLFADVEQDLTA